MTKDTRRQFKMMMPDSLRAELKRAANDSETTMTDEVIARLTKSLDEERRRSEEVTTEEETEQKSSKMDRILLMAAFDVLKETRSVFGKKGWDSDFYAMQVAREAWITIFDSLSVQARHKEPRFLAKEDLEMRDMTRQVGLRIGLLAVEEDLSKIAMNERNRSRKPDRLKSPTLPKAARGLLDGN